MQQLLVRLAIALLLVFYSVLVGGQEVRRPTAESSSSAWAGCSGTFSASSAMPNAYDTSQLTYSTLQISSSYPDSGWTERLFSTWATPSGSYSNLTISIIGECSNLTATSGVCVAGYSLNGGSSYTLFPDFITNGGKQTYTVSIPPATTFSNIRVATCSSADPDDSNLNTTTSFSVYDIWTSGTLSGGGSTPQPPLMFQQQ